MPQFVSPEGFPLSAYDAVLSESGSLTWLDFDDRGPAYLVQEFHGLRGELVIRLTAQPIDWHARIGAAIFSFFFPPRSD